MLNQLVLVNLRIPMWLLAQKELQGQGQECREFHNLNVCSIIFCEKKEDA